MLKKYLRKSPYSYTLENPPKSDKTFKFCVVIPLYAERQEFPEAWIRLNNAIATYQHDVLVILVINNYKDAPQSDIEENRWILQTLHDGGFQCSAYTTLSWVDASRVGNEIKKKGGVGSARKIGMDLALNYLPCDDNSFLCCLDGDTWIEENYFNALDKVCGRNGENIGGWSISFAHRLTDDETLNQAIIDYELYMRYYILGLCYADVPYNYYSLGSAMVCSTKNYIRCGGMKEKNGGEDFYFLQALRKLGVIEQIDETTVYPANRLSSRVAFGTGPRLNKIIDGEAVLAHTPDVFVALKEISDGIRHATTDDYNQLEHYLNKMCSTPVFAFFKESNFFNSWDKVLKNTPAKLTYLNAAFYTWFDGFRILTFIHFLENEFPENFPQQSLEDAIGTLLGDYLETAIERECGTSRKQLLAYLRQN